MSCDDVNAAVLDDHQMPVPKPRRRKRVPIHTGDPESPDDWMSHEDALDEALLAARLGLEPPDGWEDTSDDHMGDIAARLPARPPARKLTEAERQILDSDVFWMVLCIPAEFVADKFGRPRVPGRSAPRSIFFSKRDAEATVAWLKAQGHQACLLSGRRSA